MAHAGRHGLRGRRTLAALLLLAGAATTAQAARPLITDDARIVDPGSCQLETWARRNHDGSEFWAQPGCNFTGTVEVTTGYGQVREDGSSHTVSLMLQGKKLLRPLKPDDWGMAVTLGMNRNPSVNSNDPYLNVPISWSLRDDAHFIHLNLGAKREGPDKAKIFTWGLALEQPLGDTFGVIVESFAQDKDKPFWQLGLRGWVIKDRVQIDATMGNRFGAGTEGRWFSLGLRLLTPPWMN